MERLNWSVSAWRLTTFFCSCKTGGVEQAPRSTPIVPPLPVKLTVDGPAITAPELGLIFTMAVVVLGGVFDKEVTGVVERDAVVRIRVRVP